MKYEFNECMKKLKAEIAGIRGVAPSAIASGGDGGNSGTAIGLTVADRSHTTGASHNNLNMSRENLMAAALNSNVFEWGGKEVGEWLKVKRFNKHIAAKLRPCDGHILYHLYLMLKSCPEFFYSTLRDSDTAIGIKDIASFSFELTLLFKGDYTAATHIHNDVYLNIKNA